MSAEKKGFRVVDGAKGKRPSTPRAPGETGDSWETGLIRDAFGRVICNLANLARILRSSPAWEGALRFNENSQDIEVSEAPCLAGPFPRAFSDGDQQAIAIWFQTTWRLNASPGRVLDAVLAVARERTYNPIREHLQKLPVWDGKARLETWLSVYLGVTDTLYTRAVGACWLRSVVARGLTPGAKADAMLVLEGFQGKGKSTALEIIGGPFFIELHSLVGKEAIENMAGKLIVELSEMEAMNRADTNALKAAISCRVDRVRLAYARRAIDLPRTAVLCGSCNRDDYLRDETGNRRFWPVAVPKGATIDLEALRRDRGQLLAEAMAEVKAGVPWHLTGLDVQREAAEQADDRRAVDVWEERVLPFLRDREPRLRQGKGAARGISLGDVLEMGVGLKPESWGQQEQNRVSRILRTLGWERRNDRLPEIDTATGKQKREWRWHPPDLPPPEPEPGGTGTRDEEPQSGTAERQPKKAVGTSGTSGSTRNDGSGDVSPQNVETPSPLSNSTGTTGTTGTKRENKGVSGRYQSDGATPVTGTTGTAAWDARYAALLAAHPGELGRALATATAELGPRPEEPS